MNRSVLSEPTNLQPCTESSIENKMEKPAASPRKTTNNQISNNQFGDGTKIHQGDNFKTTLNVNLARRSAQAAIRVIPYPRNEVIIHRPDIVDTLNKLLPHSPAKSYSAALWGLGGSG